MNLLLVVPTPTTWTTSPTLLLILEIVRIAFAFPVATLTVLPTPYADPPSMIVALVIVPPEATTLIVASLPAIYGLTSDMLSPVTYPVPGFVMVSPVIVFKLWFESVNMVVTPTLSDAADVTPRPTPISFK